MTLGEDTMILDVTISNEIDKIGPWDASVCYARDGWKNEADDGQEVERPPTTGP